MLIDFAKEKLKPFIRRVLRPFHRWFVRLPWIGQAGLLLSGTIMLGSWDFHDSLSRWTSLDRRLAQVIWSGRNKPPIAGDLREALARAMANKKEQLYARLDQGGDFAGQAWTTAQMILALQGRRIDPAKAVAYLRRQRGPGSPDFGSASAFAWAKYPTKLYPPHVSATAWVLLSFAQLQQHATAQELKFVLDTQRLSSGWWPTYPSDDSERNASIDATASATWALYEQQKIGVDDPDGRVDKAIRAGASWLYSQHIQNAARWKDYPSGREMWSISGLALHVLHVTNRYDLDELDRLWLRNLPASIPRPDDFEISAKTVFRRQNEPIQTDETRYYTLPWLIAATIDAYPKGNIVERAFALAWLERAFEARPLELLKADDSDEWIVALLLIALDEL